MRRTVATTSALLLCLSLTACADNNHKSIDTGSAPSREHTDKVVVEIAFDGESVTPNGDRIDVGVNQPVEFAVTADAPGELHVHTDPEQQLKYAAGQSTLTLTVDKPGVVDVESHELDKTIVQLEVN